MSNMPLDTILSLEQAATLSAARGFWNLPQVKERVLKLFKDFVEIHNNDSYNRCMELIEELLPAQNTYALPLNLERHLFHVIKEVGQRIFDWFNYVKRLINIRSHRGYTREDVTMLVCSIRWTPCGIVDEFKTYQALSEMDPNFDIVELYRVACMHAMADQIDYLWKRMSESERKSLEYSVSLNRNCMAAYWQYRRDNNFDSLKASFRRFVSLEGRFFDVNKSIMSYFPQLYDENLSVDENMMLASLYHGLMNSVKYFWHRLPEDHKIDKLFDYLHFTLMLYIDDEPFDKRFTNYRKERWARVCVFFISQMNDDHREIFQRTTTAAAVLEETYKINVSGMDCLLRLAWPWDNFVSLGIKDLIHRRKFPTSLARYLLCELTRSEVEQFKGGLVVNGSEIQSLIQEIWKSIPSNQKQYVIRPRWYFKNSHDKQFIINLRNARDFETVRMIVNDPSIARFRHDLVHDVQEKCNSLIKADDYQLAEELINQLATSSEERLRFRSHVDCLDYFIEREEYDLADKFLDWKVWEPQLNEDAKKRRVKDLKDRFRDGVKLDKWVCNLWVDSSKNIDESMQRSSRFINWVFTTKVEKDQFIRQLIANDSREILEYCKVSAEVIEKFYSWCKLAQEEPLLQT